MADSNTAQIDRWNGTLLLSSGLSVLGEKSYFMPKIKLDKLLRLALPDMT
jgi:hypothetical protein